MRADTTPRELVEQGLERAREGPAEVRALCEGLDDEDTRRKPGVGKLSIIEHACHLLEMERDVFGIRLRRVLEEDRPVLEPVNMAHYVEEERWRDRAFADIVEEWEDHRRGNIDVVSGTHAEQWGRLVRQPDVGDVTFAEMVDQWSRHDTEHLRQIEIIARNCRERNLP